MSVPEGYRLIGEGQNVFNTAPVEGPLRWLETPQDVIEFVNTDDVGETIVLSRGGSTTFMAPALSSGARGLITLQGGPQSHLGIVSREFGIPCIMSVRFTEGQEIPTGDVIPPDGTIVRLETQSAIGSVLEHVRLKCRGSGDRSTMWCFRPSSAARRSPAETPRRWSELAC